MMVWMCIWKLIQQCKQKSNESKLKEQKQKDRDKSEFYSVFMCVCVSVCHAGSTHVYSKKIPDRHFIRSKYVDKITYNGIVYRY